MHEVSLRGINKKFGSTPVLTGIDLDVKKGEFFFLLGPSGCGKTTLLRILAGFEQQDTGTVLFDGVDMRAVPPQKRSAAMVFQNYALWPHMTVGENVSYGLEGKKLSKKTIQEKVASALTLVRMDQYRDRLPNQLSGGQQQRVALARALAIEPQLLLLDEPLSNLDARLRIEMRSELMRLQKHTGVTAIYVTHDQEEALSLADRIAYMDVGTIVQCGTPRDLFTSPVTTSAARFLGSANIIAGKVISISGTSVGLQTPIGVFRGELNDTSAQASLDIGASAFCFFRPEKVIAASVGQNQFSATVTQVLYAGNTEHVFVESNGVTVQAHLAAGSMPREIGSQIALSVAGDCVKVLRV